MIYLFLHKQDYYHTNLERQIYHNLIYKYDLNQLCNLSLFQLKSVVF